MGHLANEAVPFLIRIIERQMEAPDFSCGDALEAMGEIGAPAGVPVLVTFLDSLDADSDPLLIHLGEDACRSLAAIGGSAGIPVLQKHLNWGPDDDESLRRLRLHASEALWRLTDSSHTLAVAELLGDHDKWIRCNAVDLLGVIGSRSVVPDLQRLLEGDDEDGRQHAADALKRIGAKE